MYIKVEDDLNSSVEERYEPPRISDGQLEREDVLSLELLIEHNIEIAVSTSSLQMLAVNDARCT